MNNWHISVLLISLLAVNEAYALGDTTISQEVDKCGVGVINMGAGKVTVNKGGLSQEDLGKLLEANKALVQQMTETVAKQCGVPATQVAIDNFFKILQRHPVPIEEVDKTLREIAQRYKELLKKTEALTSDDPDVQKLQQEAAKALAKLDFETADKLLNQAQEKDAVAIRAMEEEQQRLQEALNKRLLSRATTLVTLAESKDAQLAYRDAARYYQEAVKLLPAGHEKEVGRYLNKAGIALSYAGDYQQSKALHEEALKIREQVLGKQHPDYAASLINLAGSYLEQGEYRKALPLCEQALKIEEQVLGKQHSDYATSLSNLALLYDLQGEYDKALPLNEQALKIREQILGKQHPDYAVSLNNLAALYQEQGKYDKALPLYEQALKIREQVSGKQHPDYATGLINLAELYRAQDEYDKALPLYKETLKIREQVLGKQHPDYATGLINLAELYRAQSEYDKALPLYEQALKIREQVLGKQHPDYARRLNNLAELYRVQGQYDKALPLYEQALKITEQVLGKQHRDYALSLNNLAVLYEAQGEYHKALPLHEEALKIKEQVLGKQHPDYALSLNNLAVLYGAQGEYHKALPLHEEALKIREQVLSKQHPDYALSLNNLAALYRGQGQYDKALPLFEGAVAILEKKLGKDHPNTKTVTENLHYVQLHLNSQFQVIAKRILPNSQAERLGIQVGDIFTHYDNKPVLDRNRFIYGRSKEPADGPAKELKVLREGKELVFKVKPGKMGVELEERVKSE
jgi:tetratricopeptide (TPR) repeat protein